MKKTMTAACMCFLLFAASISAQTGAQANYKITSAGTNATGTMKMYFSAQNSRAEFNMLIPQMPGGGISKTSIVKSDKPTTVYSLDDKNKTYSTSEVQPNANTSGDNISVKVIGKEKVGNYNCTHAQVTKGTETSDYWTTTEIADYASYRKTNGNNKFMGSAAEQSALAKNNADGFLVKAVTKDPRGSMVTLELTSFDKKVIPASMFEVPADYKLASGAPTAPAIDAAKLQNMTPEERAKYIEELKKQYGTQPK